MADSKAGTSHPSGQAPRPICWIDRLPTEIKTRIAELCDEQDERWRNKCKALTHSGSQQEWRRKLDTNKWLDKGSRLLPPSLGALFCTSKAWSEIAAPFRFKVK